MDVDSLSYGQLNEQIAVFNGWTRKDAEWFDPTGDSFENPPDYAKNSGLFLGLMYKMRARGYRVTIELPADRGADLIVRVEKGGVEFSGVGGSLGLAGSRAVAKAIQGA
jgi:HSP20 family molecular chaperone IbpA